MFLETIHWVSAWQVVFQYCVKCCWQVTHTQCIDSSTFWQSCRMSSSNWRMLVSQDVFDLQPCCLSDTNLQTCNFHLGDFFKVLIHLLNHDLWEDREEVNWAVWGHFSFLSFFFIDENYSCALPWEFFWICKTKNN